MNDYAKEVPINYANQRVSIKTYSGYVCDVSDGEASILINVPLDNDGFADIKSYEREHEGEMPDRITLTAERWMQTGTRLNITISRHLDDEPILRLRNSPARETGNRE